ncbi:hypothetical protein QQ73_15490 [Candidatus Endoriftia persephone str. Guaymas]|nr:hypothetical protein [Candidatus Endoriftia persephone str. Guaymas]
MLQGDMGSAVDLFISSGGEKWGLLCGLVMLLPHGYEGQGAEHSSARLERYLQLCANANMQVCVPTTPAQIFHMLRRQILRPFRHPLIVMTPKSLLRHRLATSPIQAFTEDGFLNVIGEIDAIDSESVKRIVLCAGKLYYELLETRRSRGITDTAIIRIEQLYPFPSDDSPSVIASPGCLCQLRMVASATDSGSSGTRSSRLIVDSPWDSSRG